MSASLDWSMARRRAGAAWDEAARGADPCALFRSPAWYAAVAAWQAQVRRPVEFWLDEAGDTVLPLVRDEARWHGLPYRRLRLATIPDTQFADAPLDGRGAREFVRVLLADPRWDVLELDHLPDEGALVRHLLPQLAALPRVEGPPDGNAWVDLSQGWEAYYATRSRRLKKGNNHIRNRLERRFRDIRVHRWQGGDDEQTVFDLLVRLSAASWKRDTGLTLDQPAPHAFLQALFEHALPRGELCVWWLSLDGLPAASELQLQHGGHVFALRADYDPEFEDYSPGTYLFWRLLQTLLEEGRDGRYWMGPGQNPYKERWLQGRVPLRRYRFYRNSLRGRLMHALEGRLAPRIKQLKSGKSGGAT